MWKWWSIHKSKFDGVLQADYGNKEALTDRKKHEYIIPTLGTLRNSVEPPGAIKDSYDFLLAWFTGIYERSE